MAAVSAEKESGEEDGGDNEDDSGDYPHPSRDLKETVGVLRGGCDNDRACGGLVNEICCLCHTAIIGAIDMCRLSL